MTGKTTLSITDIRAALKGRVITKENPEYDEARTVVYGGFNRRPALIARPADAADVAFLVNYARTSGVPLAVRSGGHSVAGHSVCDDGIVIDMVDMKAMQIDVGGRTAWAETGLTTGEYTAAVGKHGLATGFGDTGSVGIGGITLGGGVGYLGRKHGLTIDNLLAAEVVTADGQLVVIDADNHPDLFWAIRGGGGNFGVAVRFKFRLHEVSGVVGGMLILPATAEVIAGFVAAAEAAPNELSSIVNIMKAPPMPFLPKETHGKLILMALMVFVGDAESGSRILSPFRSLATPLADMIRPVQYPEMFPKEEEGYHPMVASHVMFIDSMDEKSAAMALERLRASTAQMSVLQLRVLGGAISAVGADATAFAHRSRRIMANIAAIYGDVADKAATEKWANDFTAALRQGDLGAYVNFMGDEGEARVREAYPGSTWDRLVAVKSRYDPTNLFRMNQNIPPTSQGNGDSA